MFPWSTYIPTRKEPNFIYMKGSRDSCGYEKLHWYFQSNFLPGRQGVVCGFVCDLCDADCIGCTCRRLHRRVGGRGHSVVGERFGNARGLAPANLIGNFGVLERCCGGLDCLICGVLWIGGGGPRLGTRADSVRAGLFAWVLSCRFVFSLSESVDVPFCCFWFVHLTVMTWGRRGVMLFCYR